MKLSVYLKVNGLIVLIGTASYYLVHAFADSDPYCFGAVALAATLMRHAAFLVSLWLGTRNKKPILYKGTRRAITDAQKWEMLWRALLIVIPVESLMFVFGYKYYGFPDEYLRGPDFVDLLKFIPLSLLFELVFDFFHYWVHRIAHEQAWLYRQVHKLHHSIIHPNIFTIYMMDIYDVFASNFFPYMAAFLLTPQFTEWQYHLMFAYKLYIEIAGHTGKHAKATSFCQFPFLKYTGIVLRTNDHDLHHHAFTVNYSKRFVIWDKLFGTYCESPLESNEKVAEPCKPA